MEFVVIAQYKARGRARGVTAMPTCLLAPGPGHLLLTATAADEDALGARAAGLMRTEAEG